MNDKFDVVKNRVRECLEKKPIAVSRVADALTSLSPDHDDDHDRKFLESSLPGSQHRRAVWNNELSLELPRPFPAGSSGQGFQSGGGER